MVFRDGFWWNTETLDPVTGNMFKQSMLDFNKIKKYRQMHYDYTTSNKSFIDLHVMLKKLNIKNHSEHLLILNPALIGVDPFDKMLENKVKALIMEEVEHNPWYFFRELVRIGNDEKQFELTIGNFIAIYLMTRNISFYLESPRQIGKTFVITTYLAWLMNHHSKNTSIANLHYLSDRAAENVGKVVTILDAIPDYLRFHTKMTTTQGVVKNRAKSAEKKLTFKHNITNNEIITYVVGQSETAAKKTARGSTIPVFFVDEICHIKNNALAYGSFHAAGGKAKEDAIANGRPNGEWFAGTPNDRLTEEGQWMYDNIKNKYLDFNASIEHFSILDMTEFEIKKYMEKYTTNEFFYVHFEYNELGYNEDWFYAKSRSYDTGYIRSEYLIKWDLASANNPFNKQIIKKIDAKASVKKAVTMKMGIKDYDIIIYPADDDLYPTLGAFFNLNYREGILVGVDTSDGTGTGDRSTLCFIDAMSGRIIATFGRNDIPPDELTQLILEFTEMYFYDSGLPAAFNIERNRAAGIISALQKVDFMQNYLALFPVSKHKANNPNAKIDKTLIINGNSAKFEYGLNVNTDIRNNVFKTLLYKLLKKHTDAISVPEVSAEINTLILTKTRDSYRIDHGPGEHDDMIMAMLHAYYMLFENSEILKIRNGIVIDYNRLLLSENEEILDLDNTKTRRISISYTMMNGKFTTTYKDNLTNQVISKEEAEVIINSSSIIDEKVIRNNDKRLDISAIANSEDTIRKNQEIANTGGFYTEIDISNPNALQATKELNYEANKDVDKDAATNVYNHIVSNVLKSQGTYGLYQQQYQNLFGKKK